eukprot:25098-Eustigmatos_ZCMA.PRE.1
MGRQLVLPGVIAFKNKICQSDSKCPACEAALRWKGREKVEDKEGAKARQQTALHLVVDQSFELPRVQASARV